MLRLLLSRTEQNIAWRSGTMPLHWQSVVKIPIFRKGNWRVYSSFKGIRFHNIPGKVYGRVLVRRVHVLVEP